jgi:PKD repeat protein
MRKLETYTLTVFFLFSVFLIFPSSLSQSNAKAAPVVALSPPDINAKHLNETFTLNITVSNIQNLWAWNVQVTWDSEFLAIIGTPVEGNFMTQKGNTLFIAAPPKSGKAEITDALQTEDGATGNGILATLHFQVIKECVQTAVNLLIRELDAPPPSMGLTEEIIPASNSSTTTVTLALGDVAASAGGNQVVREDTLVTFNASKTICSDANATYTWFFVDGTPKTLEGIISNYTFDYPGTYKVTLIVQSSLGAGNATITVKVLDTTPPVANITLQGLAAGQPITSGQQVTLDGSGSFDPENGTIRSYLWDVGTGKSSESQTTPNTSYRYTNPGTYIVTLTVFDSSGNNNTVSSQVNVILASGQTLQPTAVNTTINQGSFILPPTILAILIATTIIAIGGSAFWLRRRI